MFSGPFVANPMCVYCFALLLSLPSRLVIYCSARTHYCLDKALTTVGLGESKLALVPCDEKQRMRPEELGRMIQEDLQVNIISYVFFSPWYPATF